MNQHTKGLDDPSALSCDADLPFHLQLFNLIFTCGTSLASCRSKRLHTQGWSSVNMASRNLPNGTSSFLSPLYQRLPEKRASTPVFEDLLEQAPLPGTIQKSLAPDLTHGDDQGQFTNPQLQTWDAATLLNPKAAVAGQQAGPSSLPSRPPSNGPHFTNNAAPQIAFQFSNPGATQDFHSHPFQSSATPDGAVISRTSTPNGMSSMIERMNNVQDRSNVPVPKRRRIEDDSQDQGPRNGFHGNGGSGMLSGYVKQKQQEGQAASFLKPQAQSTVDLTGGIWTSCLSWKFPGLEFIADGEQETMTTSSKLQTRETKKSAMA